MSERPDFTGCRRRLQWIDHALRTLDEEFRMWLLEHDANPISVEYYPEADIHAFRLGSQRVPERFGVIAGNIVHQLRATLDNIVWQLVIANKGVPRGGPGGNQFPIYSDPLKKGQTFAKRAGSNLRGVHPDHVTFMEWLQPYNNDGWNPGRHPLELLADLSNTDKHQVLQLLTLKSPENPPMILPISIKGDTIDAVLEKKGSPLEGRYPGAIVGWAQLAPSGPHENVNVHLGDMWSGLVFADAPETSVKSLLDTLFVVVDVINSFVSGNVIDRQPLPLLRLDREYVLRARKIVLDGYRLNKIPKIV